MLPAGCYMPFQIYGVMIDIIRRNGPATDYYTEENMIWFNVQYNIISLYSVSRSRDRILKKEKNIVWQQLHCAELEDCLQKYASTSRTMRWFIKYIRYHRIRIHIMYKNASYSALNSSPLTSQQTVWIDLFEHLYGSP